MNCSLGATLLGDHRCQFLVWAPLAGKVELHLVAPVDRTVEMQPVGRGYHQVLAKDVGPGTRYYYHLDAQTEWPDPASRFQPEGVHGPSEVVDNAFPWEDASWEGIEFGDYILYELHVGTFTEEGTFEAAIAHLDDLRDLGVSAIELMPVSQFPGARNWGYDGAFPYAVQNSYGGPRALKALVNACHLRGLAVVLDVVYNHLGPEGNYLGNFGNYFTDRYRTPWGPAINFDGSGSDEVRRYFIENALDWVTEFHFDALRLDAVHAIVDPSARPFLEELGLAVHQEAERFKRKVYVIAESDRNDSRMVRRRGRGGYGLDAQWNDDFHHAVHALLTGERSGYYADFGKVTQLAKAYREGFVYSGQYSIFRDRRHGNDSSDLPPDQFVVFAQNHDQVGNRMLGERLSGLISFEAQKLAAGLLLLSPFVPLLFMGEEYGETSPFQYFVSHSDPSLVEAVRQGRRREFASFEWRGKLPDPQSESTFQRSKLNHELRHEGEHLALYQLVRELIRLRKELPALSGDGKQEREAIACEREKILWVRHRRGSHQAIAVFNAGETAQSGTPHFPILGLKKVLDSGERRWGGRRSENPDTLETKRDNIFSISAKSFVLYHTN